MPILTSTVFEQGDSISTTIPAEAARRMGVAAGGELYWMEDGHGGFRVIAANSTRGTLLDAHAEIVDEYRDVFRALAE
jgi:hypothetical protein